MNFLVSRLRVIHIPRPIIMGGIVLSTIGLGLGLGWSLTQPAGSMIVSVWAALLYLFFLVRIPYQGMLLWLALYPFTETNINIPLGAGLPDLSPTRLSVAWLSTMLLAQAAVGKRHFPRLTKVDVWAFLFAAGMGASVFASSNPISALKAALDLIFVPMLVYYLAKNLVRSRKDLDHFFDILLIMAFYSAIVMFYEHLTGQVIFYHKQFSEKSLYYSGGIRIVRSLWGGPHVFGSIYAMAIPVTFYRFLRTSKGAARCLYGALMGILLAGLFLTYKRAAWVSALVSFIVVAPFFPAFRRLFLVLIIIAGIPLAIYWNRLSETDLVQERVNSRVDTLNGRTYRWQAAIDLWKQSPILGHGFRRFDDLSGYRAVENYYLHILVSAGLVGFVPFLCFLYLVIRESVAIYRRAATLPGLWVDRELIAVFWGATSTYLVKAMTGAQGAAIVNLLFYMLIGAVVGSQGEALQASDADLSLGERG